MEVNKCQQVREEAEEEREREEWAKVDKGRAWDHQKSANVRVVDTLFPISQDSRVTISHVQNAEQIW
ncbi:MAG: hypothetical protein KAR85_03540 [Methanosarcinales archaeon]|nr:hypothetical protein [Methanosarcinales archaeon]